MRISKKKELINCIDTLKKGNSKVLKIDSKNRMDFLTQCQEMAIMVGTEIDRIEGKGVVTVSYLEQYCEEIYQMSVASDRGELIQKQKRVRELLLQIKESIQNDIPDSPAEIVFLPYKASMWDAMDSVYRAAVADGNCNVTVMPIPYFNICSKGEALAVEYEGNLFPSDISITDFREVNLEQLHPDIIFIHNPYDEWNKVTQVPNEYFSSTLVHQTEHLIYIPYFVTTGEKIKDDYCYLPAVRNAWRTFVQSNAVRNCYIKNGVNPEKIVAMGSPKFDMVIQKQKNLPTMPEEWNKALNGRKVFLLNTHLNPIINNAKETMDRLQRIFLLFKERDDVALLWRPHPLSIQTAKSMNPEMLNQYLQLVHEFKNLPNGIYDDTTDVHRAIALSDAYIGDWSSLVSLYGITGKPIYIMDVRENINIKEPIEDICLTFACGAWQGNTVWVTDERYNGLYKIDMLKGDAEFITSFEKEEILAETLYHRIVLYKDKLYMIPWSAEYIAVYNIKNNCLQYLKPKCKMAGGIYKFGEAIQYAHYLFLFPAYASEIVRINMEDESIDYYGAELLELLKEIKKEYAFFLSGEAFDNIAWITSRKGSYLLRFDMDKCFGKIYSMKKSDVELVDLTGNGKQFYLLNVIGEVYFWDSEQNEEQLIWKYKGKCIGAPFYRIVRVQNCLWLLPGRENKVIKIDILQNFMEKEISFPGEYNIKNVQATKFYDYNVQNNRIILYPGNMNMMAEIDCERDTIMAKGILLRDNKQFNQRVLHMVGKGEGYSNNKGLYLYKQGICAVERFLNIVSSGKEIYEIQRKKIFSKMSLNTDGTCGEKIWLYVKNKL